MSEKEVKIKISDSGSAETHNHNPVHPCLWKCLLIAMVFFYGSYSILVHLCEVDGKIPFSSASMNLVLEVTKLVLSLSFFSWEIFTGSVVKWQMPSLADSLPFAVPALLYAVNNNLVVYIQLQMDPATYQVLGNMKIFTTAILFRIIMKKQITCIQWISLTMLAFAGVFNSVGNYTASITTMPASSSVVQSKHGTLHVTMAGLIMITVYCFISGMAGVYTEYVLKKRQEMSLNMQNAMLYLFGAALNVMLFTYQASQYEDWSYGFNLFHGYTMYTWLVIVTQALMGLMMGAIMKHASNIVRLFVVSCAILVTTVLSIAIFNLQLNLYFIIAAVFVIGAIYLYHK